MPKDIEILLKNPTVRDLIDHLSSFENNRAVFVNGKPEVEITLHTTRKRNLNSPVSILGTKSRND